MERDCESELSKLNIEQNACIYHFGASVIHGQRSNILRLLCNNVTIGKGCVIAACACVVNDIPENTLVGGVPAKSIRRLD